MKYKDINGDIRLLIKEKLREIEGTHGVKILHAIESGSRAWGFASPDSDYDVRFVYIRPKEYYLKLEDTNDFINWQLDDVLDINGWDLSKALRLFHKSNATIFEWSNSPVIYHTTELWKRIYEEASLYFSVKSSMYQYYGTAKSNYYEFLQDEYVKYKKYFYVIRPLLACKWINERQCPPPVLFSDLSDKVLEWEMKDEINELLKVKVTMKECDKGERIAIIHEYIETKLEEFKGIIDDKSDDRTPSWEALNNIFLYALNNEKVDTLF